MSDVPSIPAAWSGRDTAGFGVRPVPGLVAATTLGTLVFTAEGDDGFVLCPFRRCTGGYCPGCGGTRAARSIITGDLGGAWSHNPWVVLLTAQVALLAAALVFVGAAARQRLLGRLWVPFAVGNAALAIVVWLVRLHGDAIPAGWLSPL